MTIDGQVAARSPADQLRARLDDPQVAAAARLAVGLESDCGFFMLFRRTTGRRAS